MIDGQVRDNAQNVGAQDVGGCCRAWWRKFIDADTGPARATRARLRRARTPVDALAIEAVHDLNIRLAGIGKTLKHDPARLALIAIVLAHVREGGTGRAAENFGKSKGKSKEEQKQATLGAIRFSALIKCRSPGELITLLPRALKMIDGSADVGKLAGDMFYWGEKVRTDWCFQYYGHSRAAPSELSQTKETQP